MAVIQLRGLTATDAERAIARIWCVLEQRDIESPRVEARRDRGDRVNIRITFSSSRDANAVLAELRGLWAIMASLPGGRAAPI